MFGANLVTALPQRRIENYNDFKFGIILFIY